MQVIILSVLCSTVVSVVILRKILIRYFKTVDDYVTSMCDMTKASNKETLSMIRKFQQTFAREE